MCGIGRGEEREAEGVEGEVGDHDREDQRQDQQGLAIGLEARRARHEAAPVRVAEREQDADLDHVLGGGEEVAEGARVGERLVVADDDQLDLAHQQRHEAQEDRRVHEPGLPVPQHHPPLQEAVDQHRLQAGERPVPAHLGREVHDDRELAPGEPAEAAKAATMSSVSARGPIPRVWPRHCAQSLRLRRKRAHTRSTLARRAGAPRHGGEPKP